MGRPPTYKGIIVKDAELKNRIVEAGDSNFFDATNGMLYIKQSAFKKYGVKPCKDLFQDELVMGDEPRKPPFVTFDFELPAAMSPVSYTRGSRDAFYKVLDQYAKKTLADNKIESIVVRDLDEVDAPLGKYDVGVYLDIKRAKDGGRNGGNFAYNGYTFEANGAAERRYHKPIFPGVYEGSTNGGYAGSVDGNRVVMLERRKIIFNGFSYDGLNAHLIAFLLQNELTRCLKLMDLKKLEVVDVVKSVVTDVNDKAEDRRKAIRTVIEGHKKKINDYINAIKDLVVKVSDEEKVVATVRNIEEGEISNFVKDFAISRDGVSYTVIGMKYKDTPLPELIMTVTGKGTVTIKPVNTKLRNPAPWLWFDDAKKDYDGVNNAVELKGLIDAAGINVWSGIQIIKMLNERDYEKDYPGKTEAFIKENGIEAGTKA